METKDKIQKQFTDETGTPVINSQGEPDIDYVDWLENRLISSLEKETPALTKELYERIYIESEKDLPKEKGRYFVGLKDSGFPATQDFDPNVDTTKAFCNYGASAKYWLDSLDWYLSPLSAPKMKHLSDEEIRNAAFELATKHDGVPSAFTDGAFSEGAQWMRDYYEKQ